MKIAAFRQAFLPVLAPSPRGNLLGLVSSAGSLGGAKQHREMLERQVATKPAAVPHNYWDIIHLHLLLNKKLPLIHSPSFSPQADFFLKASLWKSTFLKTFSL